MRAARQPRRAWRALAGCYLVLSAGSPRCNAPCGLLNQAMFEIPQVTVALAPVQLAAFAPVLACSYWCRDRQPQSRRRPAENDAPSPDYQMVTRSSSSPKEQHSLGGREQRVSASQFNFNSCSSVCNALSCTVLVSSGGGWGAAVRIWLNEVTMEVKDMYVTVKQAFLIRVLTTTPRAGLGSGLCKA